MRVRPAGGGGGGGKEAACMRPTGKTQSPEGALHPGEARAGPGGGVGAWFSPPGKEFFDSAEPSLGGPGNRTHRHPGENRRSILRDPVPHPEIPKSDLSRAREKCFFQPQDTGRLYTFLSWSQPLDPGDRRRANVRYPLPSLPSSIPPASAASRGGCYSVYPLWGKRGDITVGKEAEEDRGWSRGSRAPLPPIAPSPMVEERKRGPRSPRSLGYCRVRSWLQTLASRMPSVDERCIME